MTTTRTRRLLLLGVLILLPLLAFEVGIRVLIATGRLPLAAGHAPEFERSWMELERSGPQDIILFGDSLTHRGIDPAVLGTAMGTAAAPLRVFDLASSGGGYSTNRSLIERLDAEGREPRVAVIGVSPVGLKGDLNWDTVARSPMSRLFTDCETASGITDVLDCGLEQVSAAWRWHGRLSEVYQAIRGRLPADGLVHSGQMLTDGFRYHAGVSERVLASRVAKVVPDEPLRPKVSDGSRAAFVRLVDAARAAGVPVVAVGIPYQPPLVDALTARDPTWEAEWQASLAELGAAAGIEVLDVPFGDWWQPSDAFDGKHLSSPGAAAFTRQLAATPAFRAAVGTALHGAAPSSAPSAASPVPAAATPAGPESPTAAASGAAPTP